MTTTTTKCPVCGSENVTPSHLRGFEKLLRLVSPSTPYRCKECWSRFRIGGPVRGPMFKILLGVLVLLIAIFFILPINQFRGDKDKEDHSSKTVSKAIGKPDTAKSDQSDKDVPEKKDTSETDKVSQDSEDDEDDEDIPAAVKDIGKGDKISDTVKTAGVKKSDILPEEDEKGPEAPQLPKLKEPNVEVPKGGKTPAKIAAKTSAPKADAKTGKDSGQEIDEAEEKVVESPVGTTRKLKNIRTNVSDNTVEVVVSADGPVRDYKNFFLLKESPPKLVVDIKGKWRYGGKYTMDVDSDLVGKIRVAEHNEKGFFRIVMDLKVREGMTPVFHEDSKGLIITVKK